MCGRFTLRTPLDALAAQFDAEPTPGLRLAARYNIAPTQSVAVVMIDAGRRVLRTMQWGLIPPWSNKDAPLFGPINARAETVAEKKTFGVPFHNRRCLVLADGWYEWRAEGKIKQPYLYEVNNGQPIAFAGIFELWHGAREEQRRLDTCAIITTAANKLASEIHDRMPVILDARDYDDWLSPTIRQSVKMPPIKAMLKLYEGNDLTVRPVSTHVNNARHEGLECILNSA